MRRAVWMLALLLPALLLAVGGAVIYFWFPRAAPPAPPPAAAEETERQVAQGALVGFRAANGAHAWRGIPYAAAPIGDLRWRAPRPAPPWEGVHQALAIPERCPQIANRFDEQDGVEPGAILGSEDCLTLDVYAPADASGKALPVMVWIHGGGNVWGRSSQFDGSHLAAQQDVIVVTVQYRLGPFGWFAHPALRRSAETAQDQAASFAILDLVAALRWVGENAAVFGGDPANVTLFGESAGGRNVAGLLVSPPAEGLFHRAIIQSGGFESTPLAVAEGRAGNEGNNAAAVAETLGAEDAEALRAVPAETVLRAYEGPGVFFRLPQLIEDGVALPDEPMLARFGRPDGFHRVPVITGTNRDETKLFLAGDPELVTHRLWLFPQARDQRFYDAVNSYLSRLWRIRAVDQPAARMRAAGHEAVFSYRFDWDDGGAMLWTDTQQLIGAAHAIELPFLFNDFSQFGAQSDTLFIAETEAERERLSRAMGAYWAGFARSGVPEAPGAPAWPSYGGEARFLRLDAQSDGGVEPLKGAEDVHRLMGDLKGDPALSPAERCRVLAALVDWRLDPVLAAAARREMSCL